MSEEFVDDNFVPVSDNIKPTGKKRADVIAAIILISFSGYVIVESLTMPIYAQYGPGPGLFPLGLGILLAVFSIALLWDGINPRKTDKPSPFQEKRGLVSITLAILGLVGYAILITKLGYLITTFLLVIFLMMVVARDKVKTTALTAIGVTLLLYLIFEVGLHMRLPKGPFGF
jgi:putative tricarboxylic transport membrane protein